MSTSTEASDESTIDLAKDIISSLPNNPLLVDVLEKVKEQERLGFSDEQIKENVSKVFKIQQAGYTPKEYEDREIVVKNMPTKYNKLRWE